MARRSLALLPRCSDRRARALVLMFTASFTYGVIALMGVRPACVAIAQLRVSPSFPLPAEVCPQLVFFFFSFFFARPRNAFVFFLLCFCLSSGYFHPCFCPFLPQNPVTFSPQSGQSDSSVWSVGSSMAAEILKNAVRNSACPELCGAAPSWRACPIIVFTSCPLVMVCCPICSRPKSLFGGHTAIVAVACLF